MSFRTRLTGFFVLIVVLPMVAVGFLVFRLIGDSEQGKSGARASGIAATATSLYNSAEDNARVDAQTFGRALSRLPQADLQQQATALASRSGMARVTLTGATGARLDVGDHTAIAPGPRR